LIKPKLIISQNGDRWTLKSESTLKSGSYEFMPGVEFDETRLDGEVVKVSYYDFYKIIFLFFISIVSHSIRK
jgi:hypothetical protein